MVVVVVVAVVVVVLVVFASCMAGVEYIKMRNHIGQATNPKSNTTPSTSGRSNLLVLEDRQGSLAD